MAAGGVASTVEAVLERTGYLAELEAERSIEAAGRIENLRELVGVAQEFDEALERGEIAGAAADSAAVGADDGDGADEGEPAAGTAAAGRAGRDPPHPGLPGGPVAGHRHGRLRRRAEHASPS